MNQGYVNGAVALLGAGRAAPSSRDSDYDRDSRPIQAKDHNILVMDYLEQ